MCFLSLSVLMNVQQLTLLYFLPDNCTRWSRYCCISDMFFNFLAEVAATGQEIILQYLLPLCRTMWSIILLLCLVW